MKKLNLLKPDLRTGYLEYGRGQEVRYLNLNADLGLSELKCDIENGAEQLKELPEYLKKKPSRFNIIFCNNEEDGFMAISYLAAIYNRMDKLNPNEQYEDEALEDEQDLSYMNFNDTNAGDLDIDDPLDPYEEDDEEEEQWVENPWKIPIVTDMQMVSGNNSVFATSSFGMGYRGIMDRKNRAPYWLNVRKENICIIQYLGGVCNCMGEGLLHALKRYQNNRHVYMLVVMGDGNANPEEDMQELRTWICELTLEFCAGTFTVKADAECYRKYYETLIVNQVVSRGFSLEKSFVTGNIVESVLSMNNENKMDLIDKIIRYVTKDEKKPRELGASDFAILEQFKLLGMGINGDKNSIEKLRNELIGMDEVKNQIIGIVEVMKYNKRRSKMGLPVGSYHNVHMMLGAPGTAKTTVAKLLGNMMAEEHLINGNRFIAINGAELKGMYVGHSAPKVKALFDEHDIIFIDEAYAICAGTGGESDSFSQEAIAQLIVELEKHGMDRLVMFAGYGGENVSERDNRMKDFMEVNPGIRSRINSTIFFDSYTADEMVEIFHCHAKLGKYSVGKGADELIRRYFEERVHSLDFGNGREARSLLENSISRAAGRLAALPDEKITKKMMQEIKVKDVEEAIEHMRKGLKSQAGRRVNRIGFAE